MEKEHKSKHKVKPPVRKEESPTPSEVHSKKDKEIKAKEIPAVEEVHTETVIDEKKSIIPTSDGKTTTETLSVKKEIRTTQPEDNLASEVSKSKTKKKRKNLIIPFYLFIATLFILAFGIGGIFAKIIPNISFEFLNGIGNQQIGINQNETTIEATPSSTPAEETTTEEEPVAILKTQPPAIDAKAYGIFRLKNGEYTQLTNKNPEMKLPMASVTKVMTALVAMEEYDLDKPVVIPEKCVGINASSVGFKPNDVFSLQDVLYGLLVKSGADAACAIANIDNEANFIAKMNSRAAELGMTSTKFTNTIGLDNSDSHVSNVNDLKILVARALKFSSFRKIVGTEEIVLISKSNGATYRIRNTNDLLFSIPGTVGIKTGYTDSAGECLTFLYQNKDEEILIVILGSLDRFGDTSKLLNWAKAEIATMD